MKFYCLFAEGEHTLTKTMVVSKVGGLAAFTKKRETCIGCKTPLDQNGKHLTVLDVLHCVVCTAFINLSKILVFQGMRRVLRLRLSNFMSFWPKFDP